MSSALSLVHLYKDTALVYRDFCKYTFQILLQLLLQLVLLLPVVIKFGGDAHSLQLTVLSVID